MAYRSPMTQLTKCLGKNFFQEPIGFFLDSDDAHRLAFGMEWWRLVFHITDRRDVGSPLHVTLTIIPGCRRCCSAVKRSAGKIRAQSRDGKSLGVDRRFEVQEGSLSCFSSSMAV